MDETHWQVCNDPQPMIDYLRGRVSDGRMRLFAVACCRRLPRRFHERSDWGPGVEVSRAMRNRSCYPRRVGGNARSTDPRFRRGD